MPKINLLPKNVAELIAAGEVVERPASVIKELVENSIDAGANIITVEIQRGGITYIRVTDNGCGIAYEDVPTAFLRHATSKISVGTDLDSISTLGFRGEALAAVSSVARVDMITTAKGAVSGAHYCIEGGEEVVYEDAGGPEGTTIIIRDIFYNTPARMKFLKKDVSEANACAAVIDRIALSHPEISFNFIRDGKQTLQTSGDGKVKSVVYSVLGREFSGSLIEVKESLGGISVEGLTCKPVSCRPTRNNQFTFLNGRLVRSGTVIAAVEQAYKNSAMVGKFPGFVLYLSVPFDTVDVNVHPAKTEVRFSDEKRIFDAVYVAVKNAINSGDTRPEVKLNTPAFNRFEHMTTAEFRQQKIEDEKTDKTIAEQVYAKKPQGYNNDSFKNSFFRDSTKPQFVDKVSYVDKDGKETKPLTPNEVNEVFGNKTEKTIKNKQAKTDFASPEDVTKKVQKTNPLDDIYEEAKKTEIKSETHVSVDITRDEEDELPEIIIIGEAFSTYIIAQMGQSIFMIDKHAAHERILFNDLKANRKTEVQALLTPISVTLVREEYDAVIDNVSLLEKSGFEVEDFGNSSIVVRAIPAFLVDEDVNSLISEIAEKLRKTGLVETKREDDLFHTVACKAAIKAGWNTTKAEMQSLAEKVLRNDDIMYCPHGRPVAFEIKKKELEKQFGRIQ